MNDSDHFAPQRRPHHIVQAAILATVLVSTMHAQPPDTIIARTNPGPAQLRQVWAVYGNESDYLGQGIGGIPDINGDGINEFAVKFPDGYHVFYGSKEPLSKTPAMVLPVGGSHPITGDFWGTGHAAVGGLRGSGQGTEYTNLIYLYRSEGSSIDTVHPVIMDPRTMTTPALTSISDVVAADLDGDGADELIVLPGGVRRNGSLNAFAEIWIYRGGTNFQLDSPTVILHDNESVSGGLGIYVGHWDSDQYMDVAVSIGYRDGPDKLKFWFGNAGSPWNWTTPEHEVQFGGLVALDCDGDGVLDIAAPDTPNNTTYLYLSGGSKSIHTRTLAIDDADVKFYRKGFTVPMRMGYLGDSLKRYEMLGIGGADDVGPTTVFGFNGGPSGPDHLYDVYEASGEVFSLRTPLADVTGDGWNDWMIGYSERGFHAGFAAIYAGGPYIPRDSTSGVEDVAVAGVRTAISVWPNPARDELHIAWRGDLHRMPTRFTAHDMLGRLVAEGRVEPWRGEALWNCSGRPAGVYILSIYSDDNSLLATTRIIKQ
ncbi:MAG TPA: T9SS type A sorting domain-containing protein [Candidatus Kapabacteria bacterium]|nr:T9SS type A sorting domain-containing protein [Candidatus Kapabacteria bacterium]